MSAGRAPPRSDAEDGRMYRLVSPKGVLLYVTGLAALKAFAKDNGIKTFNLEHLVGEQEGNCEEAGEVMGYRKFEHLQWLESTASEAAEKIISGYKPRLVYVYGKAHTWCDAMRQSNQDMPFRWDSLRKLLKGDLKSGPQKKPTTLYTPFGWHIAPWPDNAESLLPTSQDPRYAPPAVVARATALAHAAVTRAVAEKDAERERAERLQQRADRAEQELAEREVAQYANSPEVTAIINPLQGEIEMADEGYALEEARITQLEADLGSAREALVRQTQEAQRLREQLDKQPRELVKAKQEGVEEGEQRALAAFRSAQPGDAVVVPKAGGHVVFRREVASRVPSSEAGKTTMYRRASSLSQHRMQVAGGSKDEVITLMLFDARQNPGLYRKVGVEARSTLSTDETMAMCNEMSGALGAAVRRWLKDSGIKLASKNTLKATSTTMWHESETGTIVIDDPKRKGKVITSAYLVVKDLHRAIQKTVNQQAAGGILMWPPNIPHDQVWIEVTEDKGGNTTKLLLKFLNIRSPDSVYCTTVIGLMDRLEDKYDHLKVAFGHIYEQVNRIRRRGLCVFAPWLQHLPPGFAARDEDQFPMEVAREAVQRMKGRQGEPKKGHRKRANWVKPQLPPRLPSPAAPAPPMLQLTETMPSPTPSTPSVTPVKPQPASPLPLAPISRPGGDASPPPHKVPKAEPQPLLSRPPSPLASPSSPPPPSPPSPPPPPPPGQAVVATPGGKETALCATCVDPVYDPDDPPVDERPDCFMCSQDKSWQSSGRNNFSFGGCPTAKREAHATNGPGSVKPLLFHHCQSSLRLKGCTWSPDCAECQKIDRGQLDALIRQWSMVPAAQRGRVARKIILFQGGDFLSEAEPLGHGGPSSKNFCLFCLGRLHETNVAGCPHLRTMPPGHEEVRGKQAADPPPRAGSYSIAFQAARFAKAQDKHSKEGGPKPEAMDYDSCVRPPLLTFDGPPELTLATIPLHLFLGLALDQVKHMEKELQALDAIWSAARGEVLSDSKAQAQLLEAEANVRALDGQIIVHQDDVASHTAALELIEADSSNAEAVQRGKKARSRKATYTPLKHEDEYREHRLAREGSQKALKAAQKALGSARDKVVALYSTQAGPYIRSFYTLMDSLNLERQAYHSGALVGNDCKKIFRFDIARKFSELLAPRIHADLNVGRGEDGAPRVQLELTNTQGIGDSVRASKFRHVWQLLGEAASLWTRKAPLCDHEIERFRVLSVDFAVAYADLFPFKEPSPKLHILLYHVLPQMEALGGSGILHEGVVEAFHVLDNRLKLRWANVKDVQRNILLRARQSWVVSNPASLNIRTGDHERELQQRERSNRRSRKERHEHLALEDVARERAERLAREEEMARAAAEL